MPLSEHEYIGTPLFTRELPPAYEGGDYICMEIHLNFTPLHLPQNIRADDDLSTFQAAQDNVDFAVTRSEVNISHTRRWALAPLRLASACRQINKVLTGANAREHSTINEASLKQAWESIENCYEEFESLRQLGTLGILTVEEADRFVDGWKVRTLAPRGLSGLI